MQCRHLILSENSLPARYALNHHRNISRSICQHNYATEKYKSEEQPRYNALGIQMLSKGLYKQIFKCGHLNVCGKTNNRLEESIAHLTKFDLWGKEPETYKDIHIHLPDLQGKNIDEHFRAIACDQASPYARALHALVSNPLPSIPGQHVWQKVAGWTKYSYTEDGNLNTTSVDYPDSAAIIFDCEVLASISDMPVIAVAASKDAWYSWTSEHVFENTCDLSNKLKSLVPMECRDTALNRPLQSEHKLIIGHNVGYDRARIMEQYYPHLTNVRFLDTMSMHIAVSGFSGQQKMMSKGTLKGADGGNGKSVLGSSWLYEGSLNSLSDVHKFYCGTPLDKSTREVFVSGDMQDVQKQFFELVEYCAKDVQATHNVLVKLSPIFFNHFPHPVTFAGMLEMGQMYLPVNKNWNRYVQSCKHEYENLNLELKKNLIDLMNDACHLSHNNAYKTDKWLWDLDWSTQSIKLLKSPRKGYESQNFFHSNKIHAYIQSSKDYTVDENHYLGKLPKCCAMESEVNNELKLIDKLFVTANRLPKVRSHLPGTPKWYSELQLQEKDPCWSLGATKLSTLTRATPKLLRMTWLGYPLHHNKHMGWGYLVPSNAEMLVRNACDLNTDQLDEEEFEEIDEKTEGSSNAVIMHTPAERNIEGIPENCTYHRLPHKNGVGQNVGSPLAQDFIDHVESGLLSSSDFTNALRCLEINKLCSYWRSTEKRILSQIRIHWDKEVLPISVTENLQYTDDLACGAIVPQVTVCGAISRRAVERTWLTASNVESDRIGSELKSMIQAPPGFRFVGADVDSEELWIASLLGDASFIGEHGCTALSWMTLRGNKKEGTDLHSTTAKAIGTTRNEAKIFNYARMYGAGKKAALRNYMQHNKRESKSECVKKINTLYNMTKGKQMYKLSVDALWIVKKTKIQLSNNSLLTKTATFEDVQKIKKAASRYFGHSRYIKTEDLIKGKEWVGGIESHMFNKIGDIATCSSPHTPVLNCKISRALHPSKVHGNFLPSRMNWVVQSSAVDYLHLLLVSMRWLISKYKLDARFMLSIHDEVRYMVSSKHCHLVALALQISNLLTRSMFAHRLGMNDLPLSVAFFSSVEIDEVIRKEPNDNCITPSNPYGLESKYGISLGKSFDIHDILNITSGIFST